MDSWNAWTATHCAKGFWSISNQVYGSIRSQAFYESIKYIACRQHSLALNPFPHPLFLSVGFGRHMPIRTSHSSGSRLFALCLWQRLEHRPWSIWTPENLRCHAVFIQKSYNSMVFNQPPADSRHRRIGSSITIAACCVGATGANQTIWIRTRPRYRLPAAPRMTMQRVSPHMAGVNTQCCFLTARSFL